MSKPVLQYFQGRGRAEILRLMLTAGNMEFDSVYYTTRAQFLKAIEDGKLQFKGLPILEIDNMTLCQTNAMVRYLARRNGLDGDTDEEKAKADIYYEGSRELYMPFVPVGFGGTEKEVAARVASATLPKMLPIFEKILSQSTSGYLVGSKLTYADVGLVETILALSDFYEDDKLAGYPNLTKYAAKMKSEEWVCRYVKKVRMPKNTDHYVNTVKTVLNF